MVRRAFSSALLATALLGGCSTPEGSGSTADLGNASNLVKTYLVAVDTSESAAVTQSEFGGKIRDSLAALPMSCELRMFRFDSSPAEVYSGRPPERENEAAMMLKSVFQHKSQTPGTNMGKLVRLLDKHLNEVPTPVEVWICTDAGTEMTTTAERAEIRATTARWSHDVRVAKVRVIGLRDGERETIRDLFRLSPEKLNLEGRATGS
ncbi:MAG: hypothetical protein KF884_06460 [Fimbriimonadaceae bacterium]|nr:hypothetical protein [Fimbriimonadaceae bacterium]QYK57192.1 MAG: hypothetical protein KF884_06460 [Fimbriimonadaceae bacterium]